MTTITQTPAGVDIEVAVDDSFSSLVDFSISLTGYTVTAFVDKNDGSQVEMTVTNTDLSAGQVTISLTKAQITSIGTGNHKWYLRYGNGRDFILDTTTGSKIGTGTTQKLGFWNATPIVQPTTAIAAATFAANTSGIVDDTATFDGYTIGQVVKALRNEGLLA